MVTYDEAKTQIQNTLSAIDGYKSTLISDIIKWRFNRVEASKLIVQKFREKFLTPWSISYEQGIVHKHKVLIKKGDLIASTVQTPSLKASYNAEVGGYSTLQHEEGSINVPQVPVFVFEAAPIEGFLLEHSKEVLSCALLVRFKKDTNIAETPDYENAYAKYFRLPYVTEIEGAGNIADFSGKAIPFGGVKIILDTFEFYALNFFKRDLTINGSSYFFQVKISRGRYKCKIIDETGTERESYIESAIVETLTDYDGDVTFVIGGREYSKGVGV